MSERLTSDQLDQLEAALEAMTPPPWDDASKYPGIPTVRLFSGTRYIGSLGNSDDAKETTEANAHGIVSFVNHARALVAAARETERLRVQRSWMREVLTGFKEQWENIGGTPDNYWYQQAEELLGEAGK